MYKRQTADGVALRLDGPTVVLCPLQLLPGPLQIRAAPQLIQLLLGDDLASGVLVRVGDREIISPAAYNLVVATGRRASSQVELVKSWLAAELMAEAGRAGIDP